MRHLMTAGHIQHAPGTMLTGVVPANGSHQNTVPAKISDLERFLANSLEKLKKLVAVWRFSDLENKRRIQKTLVPGGIFYDAGNLINTWPGLLMDLSSQRLVFQMNMI